MRTERAPLERAQGAGVRTPHAHLVRVSVRVRVRVRVRIRVG